MREEWPHERWVPKARQNVKDTQSQTLVKVARADLISNTLS